MFLYYAFPPPTDVTLLNLISNRIKHKTNGNKKKWFKIVMPFYIEFIIIIYHTSHTHTLRYL